MKYTTNTKRNIGQTAIEYLVLLSAVVAIVLIGFNTYIPRINTSSNVFFNRTAVGIYGDPNRCGDGVQGKFETFANCPVPGF